GRPARLCSRAVAAPGALAVRWIYSFCTRLRLPKRGGRATRPDACHRLLRRALPLRGADGPESFLADGLARPALDRRHGRADTGGADRSDPAGEARAAASRMVRTDRVRPPGDGTRSSTGGSEARFGR